MRVVVLLSAGRHPVSGRPAPVAVEAQAIRLARGLDPAPSGLHAGPPDPALDECVGCGLPDLVRLDTAGDHDPLPALAAALQAMEAPLVLAGRRGCGGEDSGMLPYRLAHWLGWPIVADAVGLAEADDGLLVRQALPRGARREFRLHPPAIVTVHPAAPPPLPYAHGAARAGRTSVRPGLAGPAWQRCAEERPYRPRPRVILRTEQASDRRLLVHPDADDAAAEILAFLRRVGVRR